MASRFALGAETALPKGIRARDTSRFAMRKASSGDFGRRLFWGLMFGLPAVFVIAGPLIVVAGWTQTLHDARLSWAGVFITIAGMIGLLAARSFRRRALRGEPY
jgi:hypothetical protein